MTSPVITATRSPETISQGKISIVALAFNFYHRCEPPLNRFDLGQTILLSSNITLIYILQSFVCLLFMLKAAWLYSIEIIFNV